MHDAARKTANAPTDASEGPKKKRWPRYHARYVQRTAIREYVLRRAEELGRAGVIERVSSEIFVFLDVMVESELTALIRQHPSAFKTLEPYTPERRSKQ